MFEGLRTVFSKETLLLPIFCFALCKLTMRDKMKSIRILSTIPMAFLLCIFILLLLITFAIWHELVHWYLTLKYGSQYFKIVNGRDASFISQQRHVLHIVTMVEASKSPQEILTHLKERMQQMMEAHPKLNTIIQYELGYNFHKFVDVDIKNIVKPLNGYKTAAEFKLLMGELPSKPMPMNDKFLWEIYIGETPINWPNDNQSTLQIPIIIRVHHLVGDGISIMTLFTCYIQDDGAEHAQLRWKNFKEVVERKFFKPAKLSALQNISNKIKSFLEIAGRNLVLNALTHPKNEHILHSVESGNKKIATFRMDTEDGHYLKKIKSIKKKHQELLNSSFTDIVFTALSASLKDYVESKRGEEQIGSKLKIPNEINGFSSYYLNLLNLDKIVEMKKGVPVVNLSNEYVPIMNKIPLGITNMETANGELTKEDLVLLLKEITKENAKLLTSLDLLYSNWTRRILYEVLPFPFLRSITTNHDAAVILTNYPGFERYPTRKLIGCIETDTLIWTINFGKAGISVFCYSHNNRLRICLLQDCNVIKTRQEGERILDGIFKYIDKFDDE